jgi:hypothetical protein
MSNSNDLEVKNVGVKCLLFKFFITFVLKYPCSPKYFNFRVSRYTCKVKVWVLKLSDADYFLIMSDDCARRVQSF